MRLLFVLLICSVMIPSSFAVEIFEAEKATIDLTISTNLEFLPQTTTARVDEAEARLSWIPREAYNQDIESLIFTPDAISDSIATYTLVRPEIDTYRLEVQSILTTNNKVVPVRKKPPFPVSVDSGMSKYTKESEMIDINDDIVALASKLAAGKDDQYEVVFALADWVTTNIEYNLSTITADAVYPSSWVLEQGYGVCDEMTNLFISLNRALGIPARFVSGLAYTNDLSIFSDNWGGHGWAEVYFPETGWIPFDPTYGEYGYLDSGHIKLKDSVDSNENSVEFSATGHGFSLKTEPLSFDVDILGTTPRLFETIEASIEPYANEVRFGSYNLLTLKVKNLRDYYVSTRIEVGQTSELEYIGEKYKNILLQPREEKEYYFLVKVNEELDEKFIYTFPIRAFTKLSDPVDTTFQASDDGIFYGKNVFDNLLTEDSFKEAKVDINCEFKSPILNSTAISCSFEGLGRGEICIDKECEQASLPATKTINFSQDPGIYTIPVRYLGSSEEKTTFITTHIVDETKVSITNISLPESVSFDEQAKITFTLSQVSKSAPINTSVTVRHNYFKKSWQDNTGTYALLFTGKQLHANENKIEIIVEYVDALGNKHSITQEEKIVLNKLTISQRIHLWLRALEYFITQ